MTVRELSQVYYLQKELDYLIEKRARVVSAATSGVGTLSGMPHGSGVGDKTGDTAIRLVGIDDLIEKRIRKLEKEQRKLLRFIDGIDDSQTRLIIELRFYDLLTWDEVALRIGGNNTEDSVKKRCYRYLQNN